MSEPAVADTRRLNSKPQDLTDAYGPPSNFLEIDVFDPQIVGVGRGRYTTYKVRMRVRCSPTNTPPGELAITSAAVSHITCYSETGMGRQPSRVTYGGAPAKINGRGSSAAY